MIIRDEILAPSLRKLLISRRDRTASLPLEVPHLTCI